MSQELLYGINTVLSLLNYNAGKRKIHEIIMSPGKKSSPRFQEIISAAAKKKVPVRYLEPEAFLNVLNTWENTTIIDPEISISSQRVVARVSGYIYSDLEYDITNLFDDRTVLVVLDGITDVGNFGSILRNCSAFGADGVILPRKRSVEVNSRVSRISSGALEEIKVYHTTNIVRTIEELKKNHYWIYGTTLKEGKEINEADEIEYMFPLAIVFGSESLGMHRLVEISCDFLVRIGMSGKMQSLNVATASGIFLYMVRRYQKKVRQG